MLGCAAITVLEIMYWASVEFCSSLVIVPALHCISPECQFWFICETYYRLIVLRSFIVFSPSAHWFICEKVLSDQCFAFALAAMCRWFLDGWGSISDSFFSSMSASDSMDSDRVHLLCNVHVCACAYGRGRGRGPDVVVAIVVRVAFLFFGRVIFRARFFFIIFAESTAGFFFLA